MKTKTAPVPIRTDRDSALAALAPWLQEPAAAALAKSEPPPPTEEPA